MTQPRDELESGGIQAAAKAARSEDFKIPHELTLSNGIVLKVKAMPPLLLSAVARSIPEPEVPVVWLEEKQRDEPNPNHPMYIRQMVERDAQISLATINLILYACTEVKTVPSGIAKPEDQSWLTQAKMAGIQFNAEDPIERYLAWMRSYAITTLDDLNNVQTLPLQLAGTTEAEVDSIAESFRSREGGGVDNDIPLEVGSQNGDHVLQPNRRSRRAAGGA